MRRTGPSRGVSQTHTTAHAKAAMDVREPVRKRHTAVAKSTRSRRWGVRM